MGMNVGVGMSVDVGVGLAWLEFGRGCGFDLINRIGKSTSSCLYVFMYIIYICIHVCMYIYIYNMYKIDPQLFLFKMETPRRRSGEVHDEITFAHR